MATDPIRQASDYPIYECCITEEWKENRLIQVSVARRQPDGRLVVGAYLVDTGCLGVKDCLCRANQSEDEYQHLLRGIDDLTGTMEVCTPEFAHQVIYGVIDFAAQFHIRPHRDFNRCRHLLNRRDEISENPDLTFGQDGTPVFVPGPYDNTWSILRKLNRTAGEGNYIYVQTEPGDDLWDEWY